ncbi:GYDIA family GHMP kinase [Dokdonia sp. Hel_I_53]|uniref:GYDIA family GHMP kinase n=1 Tax=Dokdonia sp. Hel_I_53 TaxID=1566287 RepID=UPI00119964CF|nr:GYDIA family GHMP kinase [Dokdonia sp. Hel_I_53]TVZ53104.1 mevalonate kinase [Dokdonia sp. Hel_I_53]
MSKTFYSHGKLLLTSEYIVLDGAEALALPTKKGQSLIVKETDHNCVHWKSFLEDGSVWLDINFSLPLSDSLSPKGKIESRLLSILRKATELNPDFLEKSEGFDVITTLEFPQNWGLGSSSTLISNVARWANVNPYDLLKATFGGSGYDIACATAQGPIRYHNKSSQAVTKDVSFNPSFRDRLFFVHLNKKQNSRESIKHYRSLSKIKLQKEVDYFSSLTEHIIQSSDLTEFEHLLQAHESRLSEVLKTPTIKSQLFPDYPKTIKSLGGWGGDFILATGGTLQKNYFYSRGFQTIISYDDMIL